MESEGTLSEVDQEVLAFDSASGEEYGHSPDILSNTPTEDRPTSNRIRKKPRNLLPSFKCLAEKEHELSRFVCMAVASYK